VPAPDFFQFDLFCSEFLPSWLPDETIYSLAGRFSRLSGHSTPKTTAKLLFGHPRRGYQHDFAAGLGHLSAAARGSLGSPTSIALNQSIAPYFFAFAEESLREEALTRMQGTHIGALKYSLGLLTSGFRANHPLKGCSECETQDLERHGITYWHVSHQYPTALVCPKHGQPLWCERSKSDGSSRFEWLLPDDVPAGNREFLSFRPTGNALNEGQRISNLTMDFADFGRSTFFDREQFQKAIRHRLGQLDLVTRSGSIRQKLAAASYLQSCVYLSRISTLRGLPADHTSAVRQIRRLLRTDASLSHPARYIAVTHWLWTDWSAFYETYRADISNCQHISTANENSLITDGIAEQLEACLNQGQTLSSAAKQMGISVSRAQRIAAKAKLTISRRPKKLNTTVQAQLSVLALDGKSKHEIARTLGLTAQTIMRFLRTSPELDKAWKAKRRQDLTNDKRQVWNQAVRQCSAEGIKAVRTVAPAAYAWLYRNDRTWLKQSTISMNTPRVYRSGAVSWAQRDQVLSEQLRRVYQGKRAHGPCAPPMSVGHLCQLVPELKAKWRRIDRLPRTAHLVNQITSVRATDVDA